jgi:hypothetical protein
MTSNMEIHTTLTIDDYKAYLKWIQKRAAKAARRPILPYKSGLFWLSVLILVILMLLAPLTGLGMGWFIVLGLGFAVLTIVLMVEQSKAIQEQMMPAAGGATLGDRRYIFGEEELSVSTYTIATTLSWSAVWSVEETDEHFFLMLDSIVAQIVPKRAFESPARIDEFREFVTNKVETLYVRS